MKRIRRTVKFALIIFDSKILFIRPKAIPTTRSILMYVILDTAPKKELVAIALSSWLIGNAINHTYIREECKHNPQYEQKIIKKEFKEVEKFFFWGAYSASKQEKNTPYNISHIPN